MVVGAAFLAGIAITANADPLCRCEGGGASGTSIFGPTGSCESPTRELAASRRLNQHGTQQRITAGSPRRCERLRLSHYDR